jgi:hypothetical protein
MHLSMLSYYIGQEVMGIFPWIYYHGKMNVTVIHSVKKRCVSVYYSLSQQDIKGSTRRDFRHYVAKRRN